MGFIEIFGLSLALAVDVFGIAFAYGLIIKRHRAYMMLRLAAVCGIMQGIMPIIGYLCTSLISDFIASFDYILTFLIFSCLGLNIIIESCKSSAENRKCQHLTLRTTLAVGLATSIDALISGTMIYLTKTPLFSATFLIGLTSFVIGIIGFNLNCCFKRIPEKYLQISAGSILILLGVKNLWAHFFSIQLY